MFYPFKFSYCCVFVVAYGEYIIASDYQWKRKRKIISMSNIIFYYSLATALQGYSARAIFSNPFYIFTGDEKNKNDLIFSMPS